MGRHRNKLHRRCANSAIETNSSATKAATGALFLADSNGMSRSVGVRETDIQRLAFFLEPVAARETITHQMPRTLLAVGIGAVVTEFCNAWVSSWLKLFQLTWLVQNSKILIW